MSATRLRVCVSTHPLQPAVIDGDVYRPLSRADDCGGDWHLEGEFEERRLVLDLEKARVEDWPCLLRADAPPSPPPEPRPKLSGANGDVDVYGASHTSLQPPTDDDRFLKWGPPPS